MPRNISFSLTTDQFRHRTKTVTRRVGWEKLRVGEELCGVKKAMGLKPGEKIERLGKIRVTSIRREPLRAMTDDPLYGVEECEKEGFGNHPALRYPLQFVRFFCDSHKGCTPDSTVTRIEYEYI